MNQDADYLRNKLASADPAPHPGRSDELDAQARETFDRIVATPRTRFSGRGKLPRNPHRRIVAATTAVAAVVALVVVFVAVVPLRGGPQHAYAATPPLLKYHKPGKNVPTADQLLMNLAKTAASQPTPSRARYYHTKVRGWGLHTAVGGGKACSAIVPGTEERWIAKNGSGRAIARTGRPYVPSHEHGPLCQAAGSNRTPHVVDRQKLGPSAQRQWPTHLSRDPQTLADQLAHRPGQVPRKIKIIEAITGALYEEGQPVPPKLRAAILRVLADIPSMVNRGHVTDRAGRQAVAVSTDSAYTGLPTRYVLLFDPGTGALLGYEEVLTKTAGKLNVPIPSVISYSTQVKHSYTHKIGQQS